MLKNRVINIGVVEDVAVALGEINNTVVFVGGAIVSLYADDETADEVRPTKDIDISVQVGSYREMDELREQLSAKKIYPDSDSAVAYRYKLKDIIIDFIPTSDTGLGPVNSWLTDGFNKSVKYKLNLLEINILPVEYFIASKWEAFLGRGGDKRTSHDFEDIIYVLDNNIDFVKSVQFADDKVKNFIKGMCNDIYADPYFDENIEGHLSPFNLKERKHALLLKISAILGL